MLAYARAAPATMHVTSHDTERGRHAEVAGAPRLSTAAEAVLMAGAAAMTCCGEDADLSDCDGARPRANAAAKVVKMAGVVMTECRE